MKLSALLSVAAVYMALIGGGFLVAPAAMGFGIVPADSSAGLTALMRMPASTFIGIALLNWSARNAEASTARNAIVLGNTVGFGIAAVLGALVALTGLPVWTWTFPVINALFAAAFVAAGRSGTAA